jgi:hypothetical protein
MIRFSYGSVITTVITSLLGINRDPGPARDSVVVACLQEVDEVIPNAIDQSVPGGDSPRPDVGPKVLQWFGLSNPLKRVSPRFLHQLEHPQGGLSIGGYPMLQVLHAFFLNDGGSMSPSCGTPFLALRWHGEYLSVEEPQFLHESFELDRGHLLAFGPGESCEESGGVRRRPEQVGGLLKAGEFVGGKKGH